MAYLFPPITWIYYLLYILPIINGLVNCFSYYFFFLTISFFSPLHLTMVLLYVIPHFLSRYAKWPVHNEPVTNCLPLLLQGILNFKLINYRLKLFRINCTKIWYFLDILRNLCCLFILLFNAENPLWIVIRSLADSLRIC